MKTKTEIEPGFFTRRGDIRYRASGILTATPYPTKKRPGPHGPMPYVSMVEDDFGKGSITLRKRLSSIKMHMVEMERLLNHWGDWVDHWVDGQPEFRWVPLKDLPERRDEIKRKFARYEATEHDQSDGGFEKWENL